nr:MAG TPA: hypothetical protein [Caudoviricetes sp.]
MVPVFHVGWLAVVQVHTPDFLFLRWLYGERLLLYMQMVCNI